MNTAKVLGVVGWSGSGKTALILPDQAAKKLEPQWFEESENIRVADAFVVDIMLNANDQTYDTLRRYRENLDLDGIPVRTVSLEGLLLTKQTISGNRRRRPFQGTRRAAERLLGSVRPPHEQFHRFTSPRRTPVIWTLLQGIDGPLMAGRAHQRAADAPWRIEPATAITAPNSDRNCRNSV